MLNQYTVLRAWLLARTAQLRDESERGEGIVTTIVIIVGFVLIALAAILILKNTVLTSATNVKTQ